jgi:hypothetical protein
MTGGIDRDGAVMQTLFSIDVEAHLKKAASHTFGSHSHYPVELVRAALRRGARHVEIQLNRSRLRITDDGSGLDNGAIDTLAILMDPEQPVGVKEDAIETLQSREGMGLLAIFAPNPDTVILENVSGSGKERLSFQHHRLERSGIYEARVGTSITLRGSRRDWLREKKLLEVFCRSVPRDIRLNGTSIGRNPLLPGQMATLKLPSTSCFVGGQMGIPRNGMVCRIRLLDHAIPWHHVTLPPQQGFVFEAAVETGGDVDSEMIAILCRYIRKLYSWMCRRYDSAPGEIRERFEELFFSHCRLTGDEQYLKQFSPFKVYGSREYLSLGEVRRIATESTLYAVPKKKGRFRYNTGSRTVLWLDREQADLLINHLDIPISFLNPVSRRQNPVPALFYRIKKGFQRWLLYFFPRSQKVMEAGEFSAAERKFILAFIRQLSAYPGKPAAETGGLQVFLIESKGPFPSFQVKRKEAGTGAVQRRLFIRRHHPLVQKAIQAVEKETRNIELYLPLIIS